MPVDQVRSSWSTTHPRNLPVMMAGAGYMAGGVPDDRNGQCMDPGGRVKTLEAA
jgi:hypothetical protein